MKRGMAALLMVILISVMGTFVLIGWQARLVTAILRSSSLSDLTAAGYAAESEIYDWAARFIGNYPDLFDPELDEEPGVLRDETLPDGTRLVVSARVSDGVETLLVTAERSYSTTKLVLFRAVSGVALEGIERVEITLALDCSGSMNDKSNPGCLVNCERRIRSLQKALIEFVTSIRDSDDADKYSMGLIPFKRGSDWFMGKGPVLRAESVLNEIRDASMGGVNWDRVKNAPMCNLATINPCPLASCFGAETNLGTGTLLANQYYVSNPVDLNKVKRVHVLFTDGLPNTSFSDSGCGTSDCAKPENTGECLDQALNYMRCSLARDNFAWSGARLGRRPEGVDVYAVSVADRPGGTLTGNPCLTNVSDNVALAYDRTMCVFRDSNYVTRAYANEDATQLSGIFDDIFNEIVQSVSNIKIQKVVPTFAP